MNPSNKEYNETSNSENKEIPVTVAPSDNSKQTQQNEINKVNLQPVTPTQQQPNNIESNELQGELEKQQQQQQQLFIQQQQKLAEKREEERNAKFKKEQEEIAKQNAKQKGGPNGFKTFLGFLFIIFLIIFVLFMPQIQDYIAMKKSEQASKTLETGTLVCTLSKTTSDLNESYNAAFSFKNRKITKLIFTTTTTGDKNKDKKELNKLFDECKKISTTGSDLNGINVKCKLNDGIFKNIQTFDYQKINETNKISTAFIEAGGIYPDYKKGDNIDSVESKMASSGYNCTKESYVQ